MPTINSFRGDSIPVAKVMSLAPVSVVAGQVFTIWCNSKPARYTAQPGDGISGVCAGLVAACQANAVSIPEFSEFSAALSSSGLAVILTAATPGVPFDVAITSSGNVVVTETTAGHAGQNESWSIKLYGTYTGGTFTITCNVGSGNVTTGTIAYNATAATVQAALVALAGVGAGQATVVGGPGPSSPWYVTWTGTLANTAIAAGTVNGASLTGGSNVVVTETQQGNGASNSIWVFDCSNSSYGTFTLSFNGQTTSAISYAASAATIQTALQGLTTIGAGNCTVYQNDSAINNPAGITIIEFLGAFAGTNVPAVTMDTTGLTGWNGVAITQVQQGGQATSQAWQYVSLGTNYSSGTFRLSFNGQKSAPIGVSLSGYPATRIQTVLSALSTLSGVTVTAYSRPSGGPFSFDNGFLIGFSGLSTSSPAPLLVVDPSGLNTGTGSPAVTALATGQINVNEVQTIQVNATGGTFTLTAGTQTTSAIAYNASTGTLQTRIQTDLSTTFTAVTVTGAGTPASPYVVTVTNPAKTAIALLTANAASLTGGTGTITETVAGGTGVNEVQTVTAASGVSGGTFTLGFGGQTTAPIPYNATGTQVAAALVALSSINTVTGSGSAGGPWTITWSGAQANAQQALLIGDGSLLTGATTSLATQTTLTRSAGPHHADDPTNWTLGRCLNSLDAALFDLGSSDCLYGLNQIAVITASSATNTVTWALAAGGATGNGATAGSFVAGQAVYFSNAGGGLPGGITAGTAYYLVNVNIDAGTAQLATAPGGTPITITSNGTGTQTMGIRLASFEESARFSGAIGNPRVNNAGYIEYRPRYLHIGLATQGQQGAQTVTIGTDQGSGAPKTQLDLDVDQYIAKILQTGGSTDTDARDVMLKGQHTANTLELLSGDVAVALFEGETAVLSTIKIRGGTLELGPGVTVNTSIERTAGTLIAEGATITGTLTI